MFDILDLDGGEPEQQTTSQTGKSVSEIVIDEDWESAAREVEMEETAPGQEQYPAQIRQPPDYYSGAICTGKM